MKRKRNVLCAQTAMHVIWAIIRHPHPSFVHLWHSLPNAHCLCCPHRHLWCRICGIAVMAAADVTAVRHLGWVVVVLGWVGRVANECQSIRMI